MTYFEFIEAQCATTGGVTKSLMFRNLPASSAGFYAWRKRVTGREPSLATQRRADLLVRIMAIHWDSAGAYGSPRVTAELVDDGKAVNGITVLSDVTYTYKKGTADNTLVQTRGDKLGVGGPAGSTTSYGYDALNRLITATEKTSGGTTNASWSYAYDKDGNRTSNTARPRRGQQDHQPGVQRDRRTHLAERVHRGVDLRRRREPETNPGNTAVGVAAVTASTVNGRDQITAATLGSGAHTTASYLGETQTTMLTANNGAFTTTFGNTMLGLTRQTGNSLTASFVRTPDGQLIAASTGTNTGYFLTDNLGSTVGVVNAAGVKTAAYSYDPYGRTRTATGPTAATNAFRYAGGLYDTTTGATKFGARYYDPNTGRFTQPDPSGQEHNGYVYAGANPTTHNDPTGLDFDDLQCDMTCGEGFVTAAAGYTAIGFGVAGYMTAGAGAGSLVGPVGTIVGGFFGLVIGAMMIDDGSD